jgi:hypothetical protein
MRFTKRDFDVWGIEIPKERKTIRAIKRRQAAKKDAKHDAFEALCAAHGLPPPVYEYPFAEHIGRKWRFDYLFEAHVGVEQIGGVWTNGHHSRGQTQIDDMQRRNEAQLMGYVVLEFTPEQFESGEAFAVIKRALNAEE